MNYLFDGILILVFFLCIWAGKRKGFFRSLFGLLSGVVSAAVAIAAGNFLAGRCYDAVIHKALTDRFSEAISADTAAAEVEALWSSLPKVIQNLMKNEGLRPEMLGSSAGEAGEALAEHAARAVEPVVTGLLEILFALLLFFVFLLLLRFLAHVIDGVFQLPVLHGINSGLGLLFGVLTGFLAVFLICIWTGPVLSLFSGETAAFFQKSLDASCIGRLILEHNPFGGG